MPLPEGRLALTGINAQLRSKLQELPEGYCFVWPNNWQPYKAADRLGIKIVTRKIGDGTGYYVWKRKA